MNREIVNRGLPMFFVARFRDRRRRTRRNGQSLVEFALVLPVFLLVLAGMVDFGVGLYSEITVTNAAREGARLGVTLPYSPSTPSTFASAINQRVRDMSTSLDGAKLTITTSCVRQSGSTWSSCTGTPYQSGDAVVVNVGYQYRVLWGLAMGANLPISATVQMRIE